MSSSSDSAVKAAISGAHGLRQQAIDLHKQNRFAEAIPLYRRYLYQRPSDSGVWTNLGAALRAEKQAIAAIGCYRRALDLKPDDAAILSNLGNALKDLDRLDEALVCQARAHEREPDNRQYHLNYAVALREAKQFDRALKHLDALLALDPGNAHYQWERGLIHLYQGNFREGWVDYESRWRTGDLVLPAVGCPRWQGEDLNDKKILLVAEQGYGDTLLAARFIPLIKARGATIFLECKTELQPVLTGLPITRFLDSRAAHYQPREFDYYCPLMSLMGVLGIARDEIPPPAVLTVPEASRKKFHWIAEHGKNKLKVGIVWSGSLTFKDNAKRACTLESFLSLAELPHVQLYSLQKGEREQDLEQWQATPLIIDLAKQLDHFGDTAAAVEAMDLIVMSDSSVAHLAGSLGKQIINLLQYKPYWIYYPESDTTPWYPSMQLIRQNKPGDWETVFSQLKKRLA